MELDPVGQPGQCIVEGKKSILPLGADQADGITILAPKDAAHASHENRRLEREYPQAVGGKRRCGDGEGRAAEHDLRGRETRYGGVARRNAGTDPVT